MTNKPDRQGQIGEPEVQRQSEAQVIRLEDLGYFIREKRKRDEITLEQAADQCGVSAATLSRLERQYALRVSGKTRKPPTTPDMRTLTAIGSWLGIVLDGVMGIDSSEQKRGQEGQETTIDKVAAHLRADRQLNPETAALVTRLFEAIYKEYAPKNEFTDEQK